MYVLNFCYKKSSNCKQLKPLNKRVFAKIISFISIKMQNGSSARINSFQLTNDIQQCAKVTLKYQK